MSRASSTPPPDDLDRLLAVFQPRTDRRLTRENAREMSRNLTGFFGVLADWQRREQTRQAELATDGRGAESAPQECP